jgi:superfamily II DNA or RNA helicase
LIERLATKVPGVKVSVQFSGGSLRIVGAERSSLPFVWDERDGCHRVPASDYAPVLRQLKKLGVDFVDEARAYDELELAERELREPRPFQTESLLAWRENQGRGVVVLPTGAGKSHVAVMAISEKKRATLVVAPTLDLVRQWHTNLSRTFSIQVGVLGGGEHRIEPLTVTTYDSAYLHMERYGNRFGLVVFDECHHLPGDSFAEAARMCIAPFRLGLTATPERADGRETELEALVGKIVYRKTIVDFAGEYLAPYDTKRLVVELDEEERLTYEAARGEYVAFVRQQGISMGSPRGFSDFIMRASRTESGRRALAAYRMQRALAFTSRAKLKLLGELLVRHRQDRTIVFTEDNRTAYQISRDFLIPIITHQTKVKERSEILSGLESGTYRALVTSKVLNEGVDVPSANVAIIVSGSGSVMEHVQRLGRILRHQDDKRALLYELVSAKTSEAQTSDRRREHAAYQKPRFGWRR